MFRTISTFLWLLLLTATPIAAQNNPILTATNGDKELLYMPEMPSSLPPAEPSLAKEENCDIIELIDGNEIIAHIVEEQPLVVKYYECDDKNKKLLLLSKSKIKRLRYANGKTIVIRQPTTNDSNMNSNVPQVKDDDYVEWNRRNAWKKMNTRVDPLGVISLIASIAGFFIAGILLGTAAIVLGLTALVRTTRYPDRWKGIGFAIAGLILGIIVLALTIFALSFLL